MLAIRTHSFNYYDDRFFDLCKEAGEVYSKSLDVFWRIYEQEGKWLNKFELQARMKDELERVNLHSDSYLAAMQQVHSNLVSWKENKKVNPNAKAPYKHKFLQPIVFKDKQIRYKNNKLVLTLDRNKNFLVLPWAFFKAFFEREKQWLKKGRKFIVPLPKFRVVESSN